MKIPILGTGLSGLVGSRIVELLSDKYEFEDLSLDRGVDITNKHQVFERFGSNTSKWIVHLAAKTDVDACEQDKKLGKEGQAWKINVLGTQNICEAAQEKGKKVLYVSTDFVFRGDKDFYTERDFPDPINWYGVTKYEGEKIVSSDPLNVIVRITYPYRAKNSLKKDFVHNVIDTFQAGEPFPALRDHVFTPTFIDDIALALDTLIMNNSSGIYHVVGSTSLTPYAAALHIAQVFGYNKNLVMKADAQSFFKNRAPRPYKLITKNDRIKKLGLLPKTFLDGLFEIQKQGIHV